MAQADGVPDVTNNAPASLGDDLDPWEHRLETQVEADTSVQDTEKEAIIRARRDKGLFKDRVMVYRITLPHHIRRESGPSACEPLQAVT